MTDNERLRKWLDAAMEGAYRAGSENERAAVVAWLREGAGGTNVTEHESYGHAFAYEIERGEHRREEAP